MQILISIDDTDNLESRGTGALATLLASGLEENNWGTSSFVTRHQLLVHPDIPYTSHNSAMCFQADIDAAHLMTVIEYAGRFLEQESAAGSDPGLCVAAVEQLADRAALIAFGQRTKDAVVAMDEAFAVALKVGVHLSGHGGSGQGVIGALAGAGLRLSGHDGRLKGSLMIQETGGKTTVGALRAHADVDEVRTITGDQPADQDLVRLSEKVKTVLQAGKSVLLLEPLSTRADDVRWQTCSKQRLRCY